MPIIEEILRAIAGSIGLIFTIPLTTLVSGVLMGNTKARRKSMATLFRKIDHVIEAQYNAEQAFLAEYAAGSYTIENPYVKLNPYLVAPLTALVMFETEKPAFAKVTVKGKEAAGQGCFRYRNHSAAG